MDLIQDGRQLKWSNQYWQFSVHLDLCRQNYVIAKRPPLSISCFPYISVRLHQIFEILVPTPYNIRIIMGGRDKNFDDPVQSDQDISKTDKAKEVF